VSINTSEIEVVKLFDDIARREGKDRSEIILTFIAKYVQAHNLGNPSFTLDNWDHNPNFRAYPTLGEPAKPEVIKTFNDAELQEILNNSQSFIEAVSKEVQKRRPALDHAKDLNPYATRMKLLTQRKHHALWKDDPDYAMHKVDCMTCQSIDPSTSKQ